MTGVILIVIGARGYQVLWAELCPPKIHHVEALTPNETVIYIWRQDLQEVIKVK